MAAFSASAVDTTIEINSVAQRWPWNNKVDITYTVTGGQDVSVSNFCKVVFNTVINGTPIIIDRHLDCAGWRQVRQLHDVRHHQHG